MTKNFKYQKSQLTNVFDNKLDSVSKKKSKINSKLFLFNCLYFNKYGQIVRSTQVVKRGFYHYVD